MTPLYAWAKRHGVTWQAIEDLRHVLGTDLPALPILADRSEAAVQSRIREAAPRAGYMLWRNNCGALLDERGVPIRYGLANDTPALNKRLKSSDLIGWRATLVTPDMLGTYVAVFASFEVKEAVWTYKGTEREKAQESWLHLVAKDGGIARFITSEEQLP
jgi:hypothetical protein